MWSKFKDSFQLGCSHGSIYEVSKTRVATPLIGFKIFLYQYHVYKPTRKKYRSVGSSFCAQLIFKAQGAVGLECCSPLDSDRF